MRSAKNWAVLGNDRYAPHVGRRGDVRIDPEADIEVTALKVAVAP
jgi:hypothetical protein